MNIAKTFAALAFVGFAAATPAGTLTKTETTRHTLHFGGTGPRVFEVRTIHGSIAIEAYDGNEVLITVDKTIDARNADEFEAARREVRLDLTDNAATLGAVARYKHDRTCGERNHDERGEWPKYDVSFDFRIRVPRDTQLKVCTIDRGDVSVRGTRADFDINTVNGRIDFADMGGSGDAITVNGGITGSFTASPRKDSVYRTVNGSIVLTMPQAFAADLDMKTFHGGLYTDFDASPRAQQTVATPQRRDGKFLFETNSFATVRIGKGGPLFTLETLNGDVRVLRTAR
jgi:hypothetical protein